MSHRRMILGLYYVVN